MKVKTYEELFKHNDLFARAKKDNLSDRQTMILMHNQFEDLNNLFDNLVKETEKMSVTG